MGKTELVALLSMSSWCLLFVVWLFRGAMGLSADCDNVFPDHTHLLFLKKSDRIILHIMLIFSSLNINCTHISKYRSYFKRVLMCHYL